MIIMRTATRNKYTNKTAEGQLGKGKKCVVFCVLSNKNSNVPLCFLRTRARLETSSLLTYAALQPTLSLFYPSVKGIKTQS